MKILLTGGAGYIGSVLAETLIDKGSDVVVLDSLVHGDIRNVHPQATFYQTDIADREALKKIFSEHKIDAIAHLAALISVSESMLQPERYLENNYKRSLILLDEALRAGIKTFLFSSTAAVYGTPEIIPIFEYHQKKPINPYGQSKLLFEQALFERAQADKDFKYAALRFFNACGASKNFGARHKVDTHIIPLTIKAVADDANRVEIFGNDYRTHDGTCIRDYVHVSDIADAHLILLKKLLTEENPRKGSLDDYAYNIGTGKGNSVMEIIDAVEKVLGKKVHYKIASRRDGDPSHLVAAADKLRALGWQPKYQNLDAIVETAWNWHRKNPS